MTEIWDVVEGIIFFISACLTGGIVAFVLGMVHDVGVKMLFSMGIDAGVGTAWDTTPQLNIVTNLFYAILFSFAVIGLLVMVLAIHRRVRQDVVLDSPNPMLEP